MNKPTVQTAKYRFDCAMDKGSPTGAMGDQRGRAVSLRGSPKVPRAARLPKQNLQLGAHH